MLSSYDYGFIFGRERLLPIADIITPNVKEASALLGGVEIETVEEMRSAAKLLHEMGPRFPIFSPFLSSFYGLIAMCSCLLLEHCYMMMFRFVLVKGGDLPDSSESVDVFFDGNMI